MRHALERAKTIVDLVVRQPPHSFGAKLFDVERRHHRTKDHRTTHRIFVQLFLARQVTHETAGKRITRSSRIENRFKWISGDGEIAVVGKQRRAVLAAFDDQRLWSPTQNLARRFDQVWNAG